MKLRGWALIAALFLVDSCSRHESTGNTIETENTVAILVRLPDGKPASNMRAEIRPVWFIADTASTTDTSLMIRNLISDKNGWINCEGLPKGTYRVHIIGESTGSVIEFNHIDTNGRTEVARLTISPLGIVSGSVNLPAGTEYAWIQIYGMDKSIKTDKNGSYIIKGLPAGTYRIRAISYNTPSIIAEDVVQIRSQYTLNAGVLTLPYAGTEDPATWQHSKIINADSLVSDWMRPLPEISIVTLKLDSTNFRFSEAMDDGRDLRIFDDHGVPLVFQRVLWSLEQSKAVIRIRIPTSTQKTLPDIEIRWGHDGAIDLGFDELWSGISDSLYREFYTLLIDDFEHNSAQTAIPTPIPSSYWYLVPSDTSVKIDSSIQANFTNALKPAEDDRDGTAAQIIYSASSTMWLVLGTALGSGPHDLQTLDSVEFWVKGDGAYSFAVENFTGAGGKAIINDTLYAEWTRKCIRPSDFLPANDIGGNIGWNSVMDSITNLTFFSGKGTEFWVDDIRLYGVNRDNFK